MTESNYLIENCGELALRKVKTKKGFALEIGIDILMICRYDSNADGWQFYGKMFKSCSYDNLFKLMKKGQEIIDNSK